MKTEIYNIVSTLLWSGTLLSGFVVAWLYYRQLRTMQIGPLIQFLESPSVRAARRTIMMHREEIRATPYADENSWSEEVTRAVAEACAAYDVVGHLAKLNKVESDFIMEHWGDSARRIHDICATYIGTLREREGMSYMSGLIWFAEAAEKTSSGLNGLLLKSGPTESGSEPGEGTGDSYLLNKGEMRDCS